MTFFVGPYGAGNFKTLFLLHFSADISFYEDILLTRDGGIQAKFEKILTWESIRKSKNADYLENG